MRKQDQPLWVDPDSGYVRRHVSPQSDMPLDLVRIELPAGAAIPMPASAYAFMRQLIWVLSGSLVFQEGETRHEMDQGDCLELGPPTDCVFKNESAELCIYLVVVMNKA
jgi:quercetin dioxygenase-like cupin family protein